MRYAGGKDLIAKPLGEQLLALRQPQHDTYIEPFCGGCNVLSVMASHFEKVIAADIAIDLILMWQALQQGWQPEDVSETEHTALQHAEPSAQRGFAGFCCSFRGVWFGGYADDTQRQSQLRLVPQQAALLKHVRFVHADYRSLRKVSKRCLIYCDPPYYATSGYGSGARHFDSAEFWAHVRLWAAQGATVAVSEYQAPGDIPSIWSTQKKVTLAAQEGKRKTRTENLFLVPA